jgi:hypothetical protein
MHVGFSASNGQGSAAHIVHHWRFFSFWSLPTVIPMDTIEEGDCFFCYPDCSRKNDKPSNLHERRAKIGDMYLRLGGLAAFVLSIIGVLVIIVFLVVWRKRSLSRSKEGRTYRLNRVPSRLSISKIKSATMGFNHNRIVGKGASATV